MQKRATICEIAAESGVSASAVSRALNKSRMVSGRTSKCVQEVIKKYNYSPNSLARALMSRRTNTIGVVIPDTTNPYFASLFPEIERFALGYNYSIILTNTLYGGSSHGVESPFSEYNYLAHLETDGSVLSAGNPASKQPRHASRDTAIR